MNAEGAGSLSTRIAPGGAVGALLCVLAAGACSEAPSQNETAASLTFALVPKSMNNPFFDQARDGCKRAEAEMNDVECLYLGPGEHSEQEQVQIVQDLITRGVDGIAISPSNAAAIGRALGRAREAGIPVLTWDSDLLPEDVALRRTYIGTHNYQIGVEQAKVVKGLKPDGGVICIQSGGPSANNHNERMQGIRDTLSGEQSARPPGDRLNGQGGWSEADGCPLYSNDDFPLAVQQMADVLARYPNLDAFVATGGFPQFAGQAYRQVAEQHRDRLASGETIVVVADTLEMQMEMLRDGLSHAQIGQRPAEMGYRSMEVLRALVKTGEEPEDPLFTGLDVCTTETADRCLSGG